MEQNWLLILSPRYVMVNCFTQGGRRWREERVGSWTQGEGTNIGAFDFFWESWNTNSEIGTKSSQRYRALKERTTTKFSLYLVTYKTVPGPHYFAAINSFGVVTEMFDRKGLGKKELGKWFSWL